MVTMFIDTLPSPYHDKVMGNVASNFADLVAVGFAKKPNQEKKKGKANAVLVELVLPQGRGKPPPPYPTQIYLKRLKPPVTYMNPPPPTAPYLPTFLPPYVPPYHPIGDIGMTTSSNNRRPAQ
ncbi:hypothetical protein CR513_53573, partial [Mucuna pruriens]